MKAAHGRGAAALSPWELALVIALGAHAVVIAIASALAPEPPATAAATEKLEPFELEIADYGPWVPLDDETARPSPPVDANARGSMSASGAPEPTRQGGSRGMGAPRERGEGADRPRSSREGPRPAGTGDSPPSAGEYDDLLVAPNRALPGLDGVMAWSVPGVLSPLPRSAAAPTKTTPRAPIDPDTGGRAIRGTLDARDQARGMALPAANEAARAIEAVVASAETSGESRATFAVELDAAGNVKGVALARATRGDAMIWARVVERIKAALAGRRLTMRGDAARLGARVSIEIVTRERFPDGSNGAGAKDIYGNHKTRTVLSRVAVEVAGVKPLPEDIKPIVIQPFFTPPDPNESGLVPVNPGDEFHRRGGE